MIRKQSKQRDIVLQYMKNIHAHVSAEQIFEDLNKDHKTISLATVYRNLNVLVQMKELKKIAHPVYGYVYDYGQKPHYHLHCIRCDKIYDMPMSYMLELDSKLQENSDVTVLSHEIMVEGVCAECKHK